MTNGLFPSFTGTEREREKERELWNRILMGERRPRINRTSLLGIETIYRVSRSLDGQIDIRVTLIVSR